MLEINKDNYDLVMRSQVAILILDDSTQSDRKEAEFRGHYEFFKNLIMMAVAKEEYGKKVYKKVVEYFGVDYKQMPILFVKDGAKKYLYAGKSFSQNSLHQFFYDYTQKQVPRYYKSEEQPQYKKKTLIKKLVGKNYHTEMYKGGEDLLISFCRQDYEECQQF